MQKYYLFTVLEYVKDCLRDVFEPANPNMYFKNSIQ
jgi:hypothetical protein